METWEECFGLMLVVALAGWSGAFMFLMVDARIAWERRQLLELYAHIWKYSEAHPALRRMIIHRVYETGLATGPLCGIEYDDVVEQEDY